MSNFDFYLDHLKSSFSSLFSSFAFFLIIISTIMIAAEPPTLIMIPPAIATAQHYVSQQQYLPPQPQSLFKSGVELSELCSITVQTLCGGNITWDIDRQMNFSLFCNRLLMQIDIPTPVVYTRYYLRLQTNK
jgi:hypothetical protein